ncbi:MAG: aspartate-semialdehyde dehydrogenase, partial [Clostridia bacterium]|nr:aspartate-semialdehyde dehydrogenase [Clostridia bacterium]
MNVSIVGCTGLVGRKVLEVLSQQNVKAEKVFLFASEKSSGSTFSVFGKSYPVSALNEKTVKQAENSIALFAVNKNLSKKFAPLFIENGCVVIDNSSAFRMERDVPLVVPNVNGEILTGNEKLIANPNCSTIQAVSALKILNDYRSIKRVSYVTFQAVSGAGQEGVRDLEKGKNNLSPKKFPRP